MTSDSATGLCTASFFRKALIPLRKPISETAKRGREEKGDKALRTPPVNVQTTNEVRTNERILFECQSV